MAIPKSNLWEIKVLQSSVMPPPPVCPTGFVSQETQLSLSFEQQKELLCLRMQLETEKEVTLEKLRQRIEMAKLEVETERLKLMKEGILGDQSGTREGSPDDEGARDILSSLRLVPKFNEREIETFSLFERVADARGWVDSDRTILLQCVFTGRAQEALSSLSTADI